MVKANLTRRKFYFEVWGRCSAEHDPQGPVFWQLLFLSFIDNLGSALSSLSFFFANDLKVVESTGRGNLSSCIGDVPDRCVTVP